MTTYTEAVTVADPGEIRAAADLPSAYSLLQEILRVADGLYEHDADAATIGDAMDLYEAEDAVIAAIRRVQAAEARLADAMEEVQAAQQQLHAAESLPTFDPCRGCHSAKAGAIAAAAARLEEAQAWMRSAERDVAAARRHLDECLQAAADAAERMRSRLRLRHGGLDEAHREAPVAAAGRGFYDSRRTA